MTTGIQAGKLRHSIEIQANTQGSDNAGGLPAGWATVATVWAGIDRVSETEKLNAGMLQNVITHKIKIRQYDGLTVTHRIRFGARIFEIISIENRMERGFHQLLQCLERSP